MIEAPVEVRISDLWSVSPATGESVPTSTHSVIASPSGTDSEFTSTDSKYAPSRIEPSRLACSLFKSRPLSASASGPSRRNSSHRRGGLRLRPRRRRVRVRTSARRRGRPTRTPASLYSTRFPVERVVQRTDGSPGDRRPRPPERRADDPKSTRLRAHVLRRAVLEASISRPMRSPVAARRRRRPVASYTSIKRPFVSPRGTYSVPPTPRLCDDTRTHSPSSASRSCS